MQVVGYKVHDKSFVREYNNAIAINAFEEEPGSEEWWERVMEFNNIPSGQASTIEIGNDDVLIQIYDRGEVTTDRFFGVIEAGPSVDVFYMNDWPEVLSFATQWESLLNLVLKTGESK